MLFLSRGKDLIDDSSEKHFITARPTQENFTLSTDSLFPNDTGLYYCAWSRTLSQAGQADAKITQTPSLVLERGHPAYLRCQQSYGHSYMFWYRQDPGHTDAKITQTPTLVLKRGQTAQLICRQTDSHSNMYWYQQQQGKGLQLIYYSVTVDNKEKGDIKDGFTASRPQIDVFDLNISSVKMEHSAVYFCASSLSESPPPSTKTSLLPPTLPQREQLLPSPHKMEIIRLFSCRQKQLIMQRNTSMVLLGEK
ncbi:T cell receptor beta variable 10-2 [Platysternon megacephalum]|nr:T cell receptor beta variable 10-2 [Platysternon megacephalum]